MRHQEPGRKSIVRIARFTMFSISAGFIQAAVFAIGEEALHLPYWPSYLTALILSIVYNFTLNRRFTFKSTANIPIAMLKLGIYYAVFTPVSTWAGQELVSSGINDYVVLFGTMLTNLATEFLVSRFFIYRGQMDNRVR